MMRLALFLCALVACGSSDDSRHIADASGTATPAGALAGLRWDLPCGADLGGNVCAAVDATDQVAAITGTGHYNVRLRFRGVVETRAYAGGVVDGYFNTGAELPTTSDSFNVYSLAVSSPAQTYYVNMGQSNIYNTFLLDYTETVPMDGGATVTLSAKPIDGHEIENKDANGVPLVVPEITPAPDAYNGQFVQMDVISVATI